MIVGALVTNYIVGNFSGGTVLGSDVVYSWGFTDQAVAHNDGLWNFLGMGLAGMAFVLAGACPLRNFIISGEGDTDASVFILGLVAGAAFSHNFLAAAGTSGIGTNSVIAGFIGLAFCLIVGFTMRSKA
jgi:YedE family putative selenium metabolism protein